MADDDLGDRIRSYTARLDESADARAGTVGEFDATAHPSASGSLERRGRQRVLVIAAAAVIVLLAVAAVLIARGHDDRDVSTVDSTNPAQPTETTSMPPTSSTSVPPSTTPPSTRPATSTTASSGPQAVPVTAKLRQDLTDAYVSARQFGADEVVLTAPLYVAYVPGTKTSWAMATFAATANASPQTLINLQDGEDVGVFNKPDGGAWAMTTTAGIPAPCPGLVPAEVFAFWHLTMSPYCPPA